MRVWADLGNIRRLIQTSIKSLDHAGGNPFTFDTATGAFRDSEGRAIDDSGISLAAELGPGKPAKAGYATLKRNAILTALLREQSKSSGTGRQGVGILERLVDGGRQFPVASKGTFYSRGTSDSGLTATELQGVVDAIKARWAKVREINDRVGQVMKDLNQDVARVKREKAEQ